MNKLKSVFIILRVDEKFRKKVMKLAKTKKKTISEYVRSVLERLVK